MQFHNQGESVGPAYDGNVSGILIAFVVFSLLVHGSTLLFSTEPLIQLPESRWGSSIIRTILAPAVLTPENLTPANDSSIADSSVSEPVAISTKNPATKKTESTSKTINLHINTVKITPLTEPATLQSPIGSATKTPLLTATISQTVSDLDKLQPVPSQHFVTALARTIPPDIESLTQQRQEQRLKQRNYLLGELQSKLNRYLTYPLRARKRGWQGEVMVAFHINAGGQISHVRLAQSSGYSLLDRSAVTAIAKLHTITLPEMLGHLQAMDIQLPVHYQLNEP